MSLLNALISFSFFCFTFLQAEKVALITGITGQDGSYLAELLLSKGYIVHGIVRENSSKSNIQHLINTDSLKSNFFLHVADLSDEKSIYKVIELTQPNEIYNLGAQSDVKKSFELPVQTGEICALGVLKVLEVNRQLGNKAKIYQASTSELFGNSFPPQSESTPFYPKNPYAAAKLYGFWMGIIYRESYGMFVCNGILFNHESPRRGNSFITRKITKGVSSILAGKQKILELGNLNAKRDWGFAPDYVECMWMILQQDKPDDYIIGTGKQYSIRDFVDEAFRYVGIELEWQGEGIHEVGVVKSTIDIWSKQISPGQKLICVNPQFYRPNDVNSTQANSVKAEKVLAWNPKVNFQELVKIMVDFDLNQEGLKPIGEGYAILESKYKYLLNDFFKSSPIGV